MSMNEAKLCNLHGHAPNASRGLYVAEIFKNLKFKEFEGKMV